MARMTKATGFLTRLRKDVRGNTLAMMAAMLIPLLGFTGAAIDAARLYVVKVRLQQACDAGTLAGRKAMKDTTVGTPLDSTASAQAQTFFKNNFQANWFRAANPVFKPTKSTSGSDSSVANAVSGTATVTVPMAVMSLFKVAPVTLSVTCQSIYDLADTDVMFILDNTGSMSVVPSSGGEGSKSAFTRDDGINAFLTLEQSGSKIEALRQAVVLFDKTMTDNKQTDTIVRYGFAPYSTVVNVGKLMPATSVASDLSYNTRWLDGDYDYKTNVTSVYPISQTDCGTAKRTPGWSTGFNYKVGSGGYTTVSNYYAYANFTGATSWSSSNGGTCTGAATIRRALWKYGKATLDVSKYAAGQTVATPGRIDGSTSKWRGCVEQVNASTATSFDPANLPSDLDPDSMPDWRPMWPEAVWWPESTSSDVKDENVSTVSIKNFNANVSHPRYSYEGLGYYENNDSVTCPMEAQTLAQMTSAQVHDYVYDPNFVAAGNTYHDYGMSWGLRMLSTKGPFKDSVAPPAGRKQPAQNIVFMTDGAPVSDTDNYQMYGIEGVDKRMTGGTANEISQHSARFRALCDAAKARGITVYMIAFGTSLTADMKYCASPGQAITASNNQALQDAFASIAKRIAMLRLTK